MGNRTITIQPKGSIARKAYLGPATADFGARQPFRRLFSATGELPPLAEFSSTSKDDDDP